MLFRQIYDRQLAQASYLIGCQETGEAIVIDPLRDSDRYLAAAGQEGLRITAVTETHIHADFVSGARELAARAGATLYLSDEGPAEWKYAYAREAGARLIVDGSEIRVGNVLLTAWHTPGHTPEHLSFFVTDTRTTDQPMGILTGDFVFVGDVGRPDLLERAAGIVGTKRPGALRLFDSLARFRGLPDYLQVWPAHAAGSACGKALGAVPQSTVGYENRFSAILQIKDREQFADEVLAGQPEPPPYFARMKALNRDGVDPAVFVAPRHLGSEAFRQAVAAGAQLVDLREPREFARHYLGGALNIPMSDALLSWAGWLLSPETPIVLIGEAREAEEAARDLRLIGLDQVAGFSLPEEIAAHEAAAPINSITPQKVQALLGTMNILDVRTAEEYRLEHLAGSQHIPLGELRARLGEVPSDRPLLVHCQGGVRSPMAASILVSAGRTRVYDLVGGLDAWREAGYPAQSVVTAPGRA